MKRLPGFYAAALALAVAGPLALLPVLHIRPVTAYSVVYMISSGVFAATCALVMRFDFPKRWILGFAILGIAMRLAVLPVAPAGSDDYYRYIWDGKVLSAGINPYRYAPSDSALSALHSVVLPARVNHGEMKTLYPPVAEALFYFAYETGGETPYGIKLLLLISELITTAGIFLILRRLKIEEKYVLVYALCPLPVFQFLVDGHVDGLGLPFFILAILLYLNDRKIGSYILVGLSACVKPLALILVPVMFLNEKKFGGRVRTLLIPFIVCAACYVPFMFSGQPFQALTTFAENWTFNGVVFDILDYFVKDNQRTRLVCGILFLIPYAVTLFNRKDLLTKIYMSVFLILIFSPVVHPWYLGWLAVLVPVVRRWSGIAFVSLVSLTTFTVMTYQLTGIWKEYAAVLIIEYVPVIFLLIYETLRSAAGRPTRADSSIRTA